MIEGLDDLRAYYEEEGQRGLRTELRDRRVTLQQSYLALLMEEGRSSVIDFGAGPGLDTQAFASAGLVALGLDLAQANARRAAQDSLTVVPASIGEPPIRAQSFDAGWSMSTLMHLPDDAVSNAIGAMAHCLSPGAPLMVGQWGGELGLLYDTDQLPGQRRPFHLRPLDINRAMVAQVGAVEFEERWDVGPDGWEYQLFRVRVTPPAGS